MADTLTYGLLLDLYKGKATVVEHLSQEQRSALAVETPLFQYIREAGAAGTPRHIFVTGNAGDGKTFAILTANSEGFTAIPDASARRSEERTSPVEALADRLEGHLERGERLLVAINRGQLDRLEGVASHRAGRLAALAASARASARPQAQWPMDAGDNLAVIDLGLFDTLSQQVLEPMFDRVSQATAGESLSQN